MEGLVDGFESWMAEVRYEGLKGKINVGYRSLTIAIMIMIMIMIMIIIRQQEEAAARGGRGD